MLKHDEKTLHETTVNIRKGGADKYHKANAEKGKLFVRERLMRLLDADSLAEDGMFANCLAARVENHGASIGELSRRGARCTERLQQPAARSWRPTRRRPTSPGEKRAPSRPRSVEPDCRTPGAKSGTLWHGGAQLRRPRAAPPADEEPPGIPRKTYRR